MEERPSPEHKSSTSVAAVAAGNRLTWNINSSFTGNVATSAAIGTILQTDGRGRVRCCGDKLAQFDARGPVAAGMVKGG